MNKNTEGLEMKNNEISRGINDTKVENNSSEMIDKFRENLKNTTSNITNDAYSKGIDFLKNKTGIDISDKSQVEDKLLQVQSLLSDPNIKNKIKNITDEFSDQTMLIIDRSKEPIIKLIDTSGEIMEKSAPKIIDRVGRIIMNTIQALPIVGIPIGLFRDFINGAEIAHTTIESFQRILKNIAKTMDDIESNINDTTSGIKNLTSSDGISKMASNSFDNMTTNYLSPSLSPKSSFSQLTKSNIMKGGFNKNINKNISKKNNILKQIGGSIHYFNQTTSNPDKIIKTKKYKIRKNKTCKKYR